MLCVHVLTLAESAGLLHDRASSLLSDEWRSHDIIKNWEGVLLVRTKWLDTISSAANL